MIDIHSHILSGLDDGAVSITDSMSMARAAVEDGISEVIATPHHGNGRYHNEAFAVNSAVEELNLQLQEQRIPLKVWPGLEIRVYKNIIHDLHLGNTLSLHQSRYTLIEFPSDRIPKQMEEYIHELNILGKIAIIAHPERNQEIMQKPEKLFDLISLGALSQITAGSINGSFGNKIQALAFKLCETNLAHFIASDAHNITTRPFGLSTAYQTMEDKLGAEFVHHYQANARNVIRNQPIITRVPIKRKPSIFSSWFK